MRATSVIATALLLAGAVGIAGCGSSSSHSGSSVPSAQHTTSTAATPAPAVDELSGAARPRLAQFPPAHGRSLEQLGALVSSTARLGAATGAFTPGARRIAFALSADSGAFLYAPTAL